MKRQDDRMVLRHSIFMEVRYYVIFKKTSLSNYVVRLTYTETVKAKYTVKDLLH